MRVSRLINQKDYEKIVYFLHRHPFTFLPIVSFFAAAVILPYFVFLMLNNNFPNFVAEFQVIIVLFASLYSLAMLVFFYFQFVDFYLDLWIVTTDRIIDIEQTGMFSKIISEFDLFQIQDVTTHINGLFPTIFNYGDVLIKTASHNEGIVFRNIPHPGEVRSKLISLADDDRKFHNVPIFLK